MATIAPAGSCCTVGLCIAWARGSADKSEEGLFDIYWVILEASPGQQVIGGWGEVEWGTSDGATWGSP